jgi:MFS family permease
MLVLVASFAAMGGFLFGYDLGLIAGALMYMETDLSLGEGTEELIVGMAKLGAVFGTFIGGALMQQVGRKRTIAWNSVFFIVGPVVMAAAPGAAMLSLGRFIIGLGVGVSAVVVPAYVGEMAPPHKRGAVVITYELMLCFGWAASHALPPKAYSLDPNTLVLPFLHASTHAPLRGAPNTRRHADRPGVAGFKLSFVGFDRPAVGPQPLKLPQP